MSSITNDHMDAGWGSCWADETIVKKACRITVTTADQLIGEAKKAG
jgi:hypothetical protein